MPRKDPTGPQRYIEGDVERALRARSERERESLRSLDDVQIRELDAAIQDLMEMDVTPPPMEMPEPEKRHWIKQNNRILTIQQAVRASNLVMSAEQIAALHGEVAHLRAEHAHTKGKLNIIWKICGAIALAVLGSVGTAYNANRNSGESDGELKATVRENAEAVRRIEAEHQQLQMQFFLQSLPNGSKAILPLPNPGAFP